MPQMVKTDQKWGWSSAQFIFNLEKTYWPPKNGRVLDQFCSYQKLIQKKKTVIPFGIPKSPGKILTSHLLLETNVQAREELEDSQGPPHGRRVLTNQGTSEGATIGGSWWKPWDQPVITGCYPRFLILILMFPVKLEL